MVTVYRHIGNSIDEYVLPENDPALVRYAKENWDHGFRWVGAEFLRGSSHYVIEKITEIEWGSYENTCNLRVAVMQDGLIAPLEEETFWDGTVYVPATTAVNIQTIDWMSADGDGTILVTSSDLEELQRLYAPHSHEFVDTGTRRRWCKHEGCTAEQTWSFEKGWVDN